MCVCFGGGGVGSQPERLCLSCRKSPVSQGPEIILLTVGNLWNIFQLRLSQNENAVHKELDRKTSAQNFTGIRHSKRSRFTRMCGISEFVSLLDQRTRVVLQSPPDGLGRPGLQTRHQHALICWVGMFQWA